MIVDTSALLAYFDANEPAHTSVAAAIEANEEPLVISPFVIAELDYLVLSRYGSRAEQAVLAELCGGAWELAVMDRNRLARAAALVEAYADVPVGVADASCVVLAQEYKTTVILTLDRRHFTILRLPDGRALQVLP
ncbi:MAG TPA: PIN domain-containing protein [Tetrasphaera sp.]|uniref:PIN domain-containing protein n=1 Tax=Nostocoides sp. TaxID=1917966 RepID=UPI002CCDBAA2|nr:PIN domain-containing protein [Tetrasphaera sp.]HNQ08242.1 PIN domain-containing protein [Tetrasphaera sp.]